MAYTIPLAVVQYTLDSVLWTDVSAPFDCDNITIRNLDATATILFRTDKVDPTTELSIFSELVVGGVLARGWNNSTDNPYRFRIGLVFGAIKSVSGTPKAALIILR